MDTNTEDRKRKKPGGNQTNDLSVTRRALYRCTTTAALAKVKLRMYSHFFILLQGSSCSTAVRALACQSENWEVVGSNPVECSTF